MTPKTITTDHVSILFDDDFSGRVDSQWFDTGYWAQQGPVTSAGQGRGQACFIQTEQGELVLRHYRRGGWMAALLGDRYIYTGLNRSRAWREWYLLEKMTALGLPVPQPVAARVIRSGVFYRQDILIRRISGAVALSQRLQEGVLSSGLWSEIGKCIQKFHSAGVYHADLNAHNILLDDNGQVYVVDFDKGEIRKEGQWQASNIARLKRSLNKLKQLDQKATGFSFTEDDWSALMQGYA
ncbi:MAG: 3-deoxy-D-manno-octulosonic acid kinase [Gammaproteobacteria bacterium]|nr:3-deoxy-D-manno-octulosonic acid kinase [Gammaproteobacteria bacterium]